MMKTMTNELKDTEHGEVQEVETENGTLVGFASAYTTMDYEACRDKLLNAKMEYDGAVGRGSGVERYRTALKNVLFNNADIILTLFNEFNYLKTMVQDDGEELESLRQALKASDDAFNDLNRKYKALAAKSEETKTTPKKTK